MKTIPLSIGGRKNQGKYFAIVDDCDFAWLSQHKWNALVQGSAPNLRVYAIRRIKLANGRPGDVRMHRAIWEYHHGPIPPGKEVDHAQQGLFGGLNNWLGNLRLTDKQGNQANCRRKAQNSSGFKGVHWNTRWRAQMMVDGKHRHIGYFDTAEEAARAYDREAQQVFGAMAQLNFPIGG
jgi:hypothetical protein